MVEQQAFIELLLKSRALSFGEFITKSGRKSPYFINFGEVSNGDNMWSLADSYAHLLQTKLQGQFDNLYGPAYKGIPLATAVACRLAASHKKSVGITFNRKELKDHGERGRFVGQVYRHQERVVIIEDVLTGGTSIRDTMEFLKSQPCKVVAAIVGVDRMERGSSEYLAKSEIEQQYGIPLYSIVNLQTIIGLLKDRDILGKRWISQHQWQELEQYRQRYGS